MSDHTARARAAVEAGISEYYEVNPPPVPAGAPPAKETVIRHVARAMRDLEAELRESPLPAPMSGEELAEAAVQAGKLAHLRTEFGWRGWYARDVPRLLDHVRVLTAYLRDVEEAGEFGAGVREGKRVERAGLLPFARWIESYLRSTGGSLLNCPLCECHWEQEPHTPDCALARALAEGDAK